MYTLIYKFSIGNNRRININKPIFTLVHKANKGFNCELISNEKNGEEIKNINKSRDLKIKCLDIVSYEIAENLAREIEFKLYYFGLKYDVVITQPKKYHKIEGSLLEQNENIIPNDQLLIFETNKNKKIFNIDIVAHKTYDNDDSFLINSFDRSIEDNSNNRIIMRALEYFNNSLLSRSAETKILGAFTSLEILVNILNDNHKKTKNEKLILIQNLINYVDSQQIENNLKNEIKNGLNNLKSQSITRRIINLISDSKVDIPDISDMAKFIKDSYGIRSRIIHGSQKTVEDESQLWDISNKLKKVILSVIEFQLG